MSLVGPRRVWVLNLDAEHELERGRGYAPTRRLLEIVALQRRRLLGSLVGPEDVVLDALLPEGAAREALRGAVGLAWCPTPRARALLEAVGARPEAAPPFEVLRAVNARPFAADVRAPLAGASFEKHVVTSLEGALERLARPAALGWLVRRTFGAAGRGRRRLHAGRCEPEARAWLVASLRQGPLVIEPWVTVTREHTRSGWVAPDGSVSLSAPCFQATTREGAWVRSERCERGSLAPGDDARLEEAAARAGAALAAAGYHGPYGIDAYHHRGAHGEVLNPLSEINARFTMDWTTAMAEAARAGDAGRRLSTLLAGG